MNSVKTVQPFLLRCLTNAENMISCQFSMSKLHGY